MMVRHVLSVCLSNPTLAFHKMGIVRSPTTIEQF